MTNKVFNMEHWKKNVALFLVGQGITLIGSSLVSYAIMWHVTLKTQSGIMMSVFVVATMLPMFFMSPFGGVWADRFNKKYIINIADGSIAIVTLVIAIFYSIGFENIVLLFICAIVRSAGQGVQMPAVTSLIPQITPEKHLVRINGINSTIQSISTLGSPALAGLLMTFAPLQVIFFIDVVTAAIGISVLFFFVKTPPKTKQERELLKGRTYFTDIKEGVKYALKRSFIKRFIVVATLFNILLAPAMFLAILQVTRNFGADVWRLSLTELGFSIGMLIGGIVVAVWGGFKNKTVTVIFGTIIFGAATIGLGLMNIFGLYIVCMAVCGAAVPFFNTASLSIFQIKVDSEYMGRIMSVITMISSLVMPLGMLVFGPLGDVISIDLIMIVTGIGTMIVALYIIMDKVLIDAGK